MDFLNSFTDGNDFNLRQLGTLKVLSTHTRRQPSFLFYGDSVIKSCERAQQDPESPVLFSDSIQDLIDSLKSNLNLWYLDCGNLSDDYRPVLKG